MHDEGGVAREDLGLAGGEARVRILRPARLEAEVPERPGVFDVVGLVEDDLGRVAEPDEAGGGGDPDDRGRGGPAGPGPPWPGRTVW